MRTIDQENFNPKKNKHNKTFGSAERILFEHPNKFLIFKWNNEFRLPGGGF
jgi:hypothetical protein